MKGLEELTKDVLKEREESEKKQQELANEIIGAAIKIFADISVKSVKIKIDNSDNKEIAVYLGEEKKESFAHLIYVKKVFNNIINILTSKYSNMEQYFTINVNPESSIEIMLKYNAWTKKGGNIPPFFVYIRKLNTEQKFYIFFKKLLTK